MIVPVFTVIVPVFTVIVPVFTIIVPVFIVLFSVVSAAWLQQVQPRTHVDGLDSRVVGRQVTLDRIDPGLESLHPVDEKVSPADVFAHSDPRLPAVTVLADRNEQVCPRGVASDRGRDISKYEKRRPGDRTRAGRSVATSIAAKTASQRARAGRARQARQQCSSRQCHP
jgi:hypothetical protein